MEEKPEKNIKRRIWIERAFLISIIIIIAGWAASQHFGGKPCTICVDGKAIVTVESAAAAKALLNQLRTPSDVKVRHTRFDKIVTVRPARQNAEVVPIPEAAGMLENLLSVRAEAFAISVNEEPIVALVKEEDALKTLEIVKKRFASKVDNLSEEPTFKENVGIERKYVEISKICPTPEKAADILVSITDEPIYHVVKAGDRAVFIAQQYEVSLTDLKKLNPNINLDALVEGDRLLIKPPKPPVTVITKSLITKVTEVTAPSELRYRTGTKTGKRVTKTVITFENGKPINSEVISQVTVWNKPAPPQ
ncbi:MAG: LysM domain-containing protein [Armatimonadetes bacterium]|nr:LysM domain-containing protein [Armatimonadota bacterium]